MDRFLRTAVEALNTFHTQGDLRTLALLVVQISDVVHPEQPEVNTARLRTALGSTVPYR